MKSLSLVAAPVLIVACVDYIVGAFTGKPPLLMLGAMATLYLIAVLGPDARRAGSAFVAAFALFFVATFGVSLIWAVAS